MPFEPPKISFMLFTERGMEERIGYLIRIKEQAWVFTKPDEIHLDPLKAEAYRLDPSRLIEHTNAQTGLKYYLYNGGPLRQIE